MPKLKRPITSEDVEGLRAPPAKRQALLWDGGARGVQGFGVRATSGGSKSFILDYRTGGGRRRRIVIGAHPALTASEARKVAKRFLGVVAAGGDPLREREAERDAQGRTLAALADRYLDHLRQRDDPPPPTERTLTLYTRDYLGRFLLPRLGTRAVVDITREDLQRLHRKIGRENGKYLANRVLQFAGAMAKYGELIGWWPSGKGFTRGIRSREKRRNEEIEVMLKPRQFARLLDALVEAEKDPRQNPFAIACVRFLLWSGWRPEEAFNLKWSDLDLDAGRVRLTRTKTRVDGERRVLLSEAVAVLKKVPRIVGHPYVFPGAKPRRPLTHVNRTWRSLRKAAELEDLGAGLGPMRLRDLRHNFVGQLISNGYDLPRVGKLVGHQSPATTLRYGGFAPDKLRAMGDEGFARVRKEIEEARKAGGVRPIDGGHRAAE